MKKADTQMQIRCNTEYKTILALAAKKNNVSLSNYVLIAALNKAKKNKKEWVDV